jgi:two-component system CheB/CheR fusion protein
MENPLIRKSPKGISSGEKNKPGQKLSFPIVALGGSAGSFPAYESFFRNMPADSGMAFIVILHLAPHLESRISSVIQNYTSMKVIEATDGVVVEPDSVYIIPPNRDMGIHNRKLLLMATADKIIRQPIDYFFQSLANDQWNMAIAIVLSGMGADGETGVRMIKENLGLTIAQDPETAEFPSMPLAAIDTNVIDFVTTPEEMPLKIIQFMHHPIFDHQAATDGSHGSPKVNTAIQKILMMLRTQTGNDFALYKKSTVTRRIDRRVAFHQFLDYNEYVNYLTGHPEEIEALLKELLIGVTKFFRDIAAFESLKTNITELLSHKEENEPLRIWVAACSTGEEAYSIAMLVVECVTEAKRLGPKTVQIYATDLDRRALEHARIGMYHSNITADVSPERLERFFTKVEGRYQVKKEIRDIIVFAPQNIVKDPPFIKLDLLCCRNLLIYFTAELQKRIIPLFFYALNPDGIMFMGPAESLGAFGDMFTVIDPRWKLFRRKDGKIVLSNIVDFPFSFTKQAPTRALEKIRPETTNRTIGETFNKVLMERFSPASLLINDKGDILYNNGKTSRFLEFPRGETTVNNIYNLAKEEFQYAIGIGIEQALQSPGQTFSTIVMFQEGLDLHPIDVQCLAILEPEQYPSVIIAFQQQALLTRLKDLPVSNKDSQGTDQLKKELVFTKQKLSNTVERMDSSLEKLKLGNEELQSINEELQSTNEEALTTKEEMQSLNEELMTINIQYQSKAEELTLLNNDMKNLLDSTEVRTLFLDNDLRILRFTPSLRQIFNLIASDVGRPIAHIVSNFETPLEESMIRDVIDTLAVEVVDLKLKNGDWYRLRIMPYRTLDNYISGAVLTLIPITDYKRMESGLQVVRNYLSQHLEQTAEPTAHLDNHGKILVANQKFADFVDVSIDELPLKTIRDLLNPHSKEDLIGFINQSLQLAETISRQFELMGNHSGIYRLSATPVFETPNTTSFIIFAIHDKP